MSETQTDGALPPVRKEIVVRCRQALAFEVFTARLATWWPMASHSVGQAATRGVTLEPRVGGRLYETCADGTEHAWGEITRWDPPYGFDCTWHPGRPPSQAQTLSLRFVATEVGDAEGTRVELVHSGWEALADQAQDVRGGYNGGWELVFVERFAGAANTAAADTAAAHIDDTNAES